MTPKQKETLESFSLRKIEVGSHINESKRKDKTSAGTHTKFNDEKHLTVSVNGDGY